MVGVSMRHAMRGSVATALFLAVVMTVSGCGRSDHSLALRSRGAPTSTTAWLGSGPARDYPAYLIHRVEPAPANPKATFSPLDAAQLDEIVVAPTRAWITGSSQTGGTAPAPMGVDTATRIILVSYSSPTPGHMVNGTLVGENQNRLVWVVQSGPHRCPETTDTSANGQRWTATSWEIIDARTGAALTLESEGACEPTGGP